MEGKGYILAFRELSLGKQKAIKQYNTFYRRGIREHSIKATH